MDIRQLRYFLAIVEEGQISRAAKKLNMAQPPLSQQLRLMEEELGVTLLERQRNKKSVELTEAGKVLYEKARHVLHVFEESMREVKETGDGVRGELSLGVALLCASYLPEKLQRFREQYPHVSFRLWGGDPFSIRERLERRDIELAIVSLPIDDSGLSMVRLGTEPFVLVAPTSWEMLNDQTAVSITELADVPLLLVRREKGEGLYEQLMAEWGRFGIRPNVVCECQDVHIVLSLVAFGMGASIMPRTAIPPFIRKELRVLEITDTALCSETALVWLKDRYLSKAAQRLIKMLAE
ncbi:bacterial regulatory helix-turn-helix, lysR family protein [Anoxybacillus sp. B7M1]|uniref:LysR family transcriptional regulator n=1 Tax=unclassified Anoxybacillus TaxID=2639704 RepID=UPI0005CDC158|nr:MULTISPECIES: LysR family transcriptional regulator [unclassified Anoxybacillus]ANB57436.1 bacterial regulatory helix-turn-helix, lysR family protein [Anoxybacillus sp. B2M1]ANB64283.1 bacterial regulatory helix-turn-helix, lysR family protein [Anoxybacillus sp. B7M1]